MRKAKYHKNALITAAVCFLAYGAVFVSVNADRIARLTSEEPVHAEQPSESIDMEAHFDENYYAGPRFDNAMSPDNPEPYNEFNPDSSPELRSI